MLVVCEMEISLSKNKNNASPLVVFSGFLCRFSQHYHSSSFDFALFFFPFFCFLDFFLGLMSPGVNSALFRLNTVDLRCLGNSLADGSGSANPMLAVQDSSSLVQDISKALSPGKISQSSY